MAISISDWYNFKSKLITPFNDGDNDNLDPCHSASNRTEQIYA